VTTTTTNRMLNAKIFGAEESPLDVEDRRESGPHNALSVISPYTKSTCVDDELSSRTPIIRFVGYNWHLGNLGPSSYGKLAGSSMRARLSNFDQVHPNDGRLFLNTSSTKRVPTADDLGLSPQSMTRRAVPAPDTGRTCTDVDIDPDACATRNAFGSNPVGAGNDPWFSAIVDMKATSPSLLTTRYGTGQWIDLRLSGWTDARSYSRS
jgi:hypothetical protein